MAHLVSGVDHPTADVRRVRWNSRSDEVTISIHTPVGLVVPSWSRWLSWEVRAGPSPGADVVHLRPEGSVNNSIAPQILGF
jgi:hypothetical protein